MTNELKQTTDDTKLILAQLAEFRNKQAEPDYKMSRHNLLTEAFKGLLIINGGGVVALLGFLQAVWDQGPELRQIVLVGIGWMLGGLVVAVLSIFLRFHHSKFGELDDKAEPHSKNLRISLKIAYTVCQYGSVACFACGAYYLVCHTLKID